MIHLIARINKIKVDLAKIIQNYLKKIGGGYVLIGIDGGTLLNPTIPPKTKHLK